MIPQLYTFLRRGSNKLTEYYKIYWDIKKEHFDKVVCFGSTSWYFIYYHDVEIVQKLIKKPMKTYFGAQGFHIKDKDFYFDILTKSGYKVVVVDQIEN